MEAVFERKPLPGRLPNLYAYTWQTPGQPLTLADGQVHIWKVDLDTLDRLAALDFLTKDERKRALRLISPLKRSRFQAAHAALRVILSYYLQQSPASLRFEYGSLGKPCLQQSGGTPLLAFNMSHSENLMLLALTKKQSIGIDLEVNRAISAKKSILQQHFSAQDQAAFLALPDQIHNLAFLCAWVYKEAYSKALGTGLAATEKRSYFDAGISTPLSGSFYQSRIDHDFCFLRFTPSTGFTAAVALQSTQHPQVNFWKFVQNTDFEGT